MPSGIRSRGSICCLLSELGFSVRTRIRGLRASRRRHGLGRDVRRLLDRLDEDGSAWLTDVHAGGLLHPGVAVRAVILPLPSTGRAYSPTHGFLPIASAGPSGLMN